MKVVLNGTEAKKNTCLKISGKYIEFKWTLIQKLMTVFFIEKISNDRVPN